MHDMITRTLIVAKAAVTWLTVAAGVLTIAAEELTAIVGADHPVTTWLLRAVAWLGVAIAIIRRSTPVLPEARGVLPPPDGAPITLAEREYLNAYIRNIS